MKPLYLIALFSPLFVALSFAVVLILLGGVSVIKIPFLTFGKRQPMVAAELVFVN